MSKLKVQTISGPKVFTLVFMLALVAFLLAAPAHAQVPSGASSVGETDLTAIWIFDEDQELQKFVIEDNDLRGYTKGMKLIEITVDGEDVPDGSLSMGEVVVYRVLQLAFEQLWPEDVPSLADLAVTYHHPGEDQKAALEYMTEAFSRGDAQLEVAQGVTEMNYDLDAYHYIFTNNDTGETFETWVLDGVFPDGFFELRTKIVTGQATAAEETDFLARFEETRDTFLTAEPDELFEVEQEEEPTPYWQLIFALGLLGVIIASIGHSFLVRRK